MLGRPFHDLTPESHLRDGFRGDLKARLATIVASPGTYDQKHVSRIAGVADCVAYGPGVLELAHQPDEWCGIDDLMNASRVLALTALDLAGAA